MNEPVFDTGGATPAVSAGVVCPVCSHDSFDDLSKSLVQCRECGFVLADVPRDAESLLKLYGVGYFEGDEYADYLGDKKVYQKNLDRWLRIVRRYTPGGSLVEVGSAYGFFLELAQEHFDAFGYDVSEEAVRYANDVIGVHTRSHDFLSDDSLATGSVDAVAMWDLIEHVAKPDRFIERSAEVLRPGGHLFLTTGDIDSWLPRRQGLGWRLIHPPTHLSYFSAKTMTRLLNRKGFDVETISHPGYWRSIHQILYGLFVFGRTGRPPAAYRILDLLLPGRVGIYLNTFDIMYVVARKRGS